MAFQVQEALERGDVDAVGDILHESWERKKRFAENVSNARIDELYERARAEGARGGKIAGAGGGGFLMLFCAPEYQDGVTCALEAAGLRRMGFHFEHGGARVLMNAGLRLNGRASAVAQ
jgi:D-glycero-alpha-D-manno-heptose-7-phosphate kinase